MSSASWLLVFNEPTATEAVAVYVFVVTAFTGATSAKGALQSRVLTFPVLL